MYLTYDDYIQMGGTLDETAFIDLEFEAQAIVDWWTLNRLENETEYPEKVKMCIYKLIKLIHDKQLAQAVNTSNTTDGGVAVNAGILRQSNDGVTTDYNVLSVYDVIDNSKDEIEHTVRMYLNGVRNSLGRKLLYRGIYPDE